MKKLIFIFLLALSACSNNKTLSEEEINQIIDQKIEQITPPKAEYEGLEALNLELENLAKEASKSTFMITCLNRENVAISSGSGAIFAEDKDYYYGFTNFHVIDEATSYQVNFIQDKAYEASLVASSMETDLAVIKVKKDLVKENVQIAKFADYNTIKNGQLVMAVGSPNGINYFNSVTLGIISGVDRMLEISDSNGDGIKDYTIKMIQHDAAINHGNSGGPLFNLKGEIVGVNTLKIVFKDTENIGCAIASDYASHVVYQLLKEQKFEVVTLGVYASVYAVETGDDIIKNGVQIKEIIPGGSVANSKSNIQVDDILFELNGKKIFNSVDIKDALFTTKKGSTVEAKLYRKGEIVKTTITF